VRTKSFKLQIVFRNIFFQRQLVKDVLTLFIGIPIQLPPNIVTYIVWKPYQE